ncbi:MAG TPA: hypothetical protein PKA55_05490 [Rhodoblastus sp.]|nr:hypothetical protein [Rhodoblastus sp.]
MSDLSELHAPTMRRPSHPRSVFDVVALIAVVLAAALAVHLASHRAQATMAARSPTAQAAQP